MFGVTLALRFVRSRRHGKLTRFMSFASTCGIAIGVFAAIVGFSAMNGFEYELEHRVLSVIPSAQVNSGGAEFKDEASLLEVVKAGRGIEAVAPAIEERVILAANRAFAPVNVVGIMPEKERLVVGIERFVPQGLTVIAEPSSNNNILLGAALARRLQVNIGDSLEMMLLPKEQQLSAELLRQSLQAPVKQQVTVVGVIEVGGQLDTVMAFMNIEDLARLSERHSASTLHIKTNPWQESRRLVMEAVQGKVHEHVYLTTWMTSQGKLYHDIQMVRQIMFIALFLVLAVACFNIVSNLVMLVRDKRREVAILMTMGMSRGRIVRLFSMVGMLSAGQGLALGFIFGIVFAIGIEPATIALKEYFGITLLNADVYFIDFIPCRLEVTDLAFIFILTVCLSFLASLYPAFSASRSKPAQVLVQD